MTSRYDDQGRIQESESPPNDQGVEKAEEITSENPHYHSGPWLDFTQYICNYCGYSTLETGESGMNDHLRAAHDDLLPKPPQLTREFEGTLYNAQGELIREVRNG